MCLLPTIERSCKKYRKIKDKVKTFDKFLKPIKDYIKHNFFSLKSQIINLVFKIPLTLKVLKKENSSFSQEECNLP